MSDAEQELRIEREEANGRGAFFIMMGGSRVAELAYSRLDGNRVNIFHTQVGPQLQGRGVARRLLNAAIAWARETDTRIAATCPYAKAQFEKDASIRDVYDP